MISCIGVVEVVARPAGGPRYGFFFFFSIGLMIYFFGVYFSSPYATKGLAECEMMMLILLFCLPALLYYSEAIVG
jgi:hypothetical protein